MARVAISSRSLLSKVKVVLLVVALLCGSGMVWPAPVRGAQVLNRSVRLSNDEAAATGVEYRWSFDIPSTAPVGSIRLLLCSNTPLYDDVCTAPFGFDASNTVLDSQFGVTGFLISTDSTSNEIILTRPPAMVTPPVTAQYNFSNIRNPSNGGSLYARVLTYSSSDASGPFIDFGGMALMILPGFSLSAEVPPYLTFCLGESIPAFDCSASTEPFSELGDLTPNITSAAQSQVVVATNGQSGYTLRAAGTTLTSGNNLILPMNGETAVKGTSQFGLNLRANSSPTVGQNVQGPGTATVDPAYDQPDHFRFSSGDIIASALEPNDFRKYTVTYVVNVPKGQPGGVYSTTITYVCLANF